MRKKGTQVRVHRTLVQPREKPFYEGSTLPRKTRELVTVCAACDGTGKITVRDINPWTIPARVGLDDPAEFDFDPTEMFNMDDVFARIQKDKGLMKRLRVSVIEVQHKRKAARA